MVHVPKLVTKCNTCGNKHPYYEGGCPLNEVYRKRKSFADIPQEFFGDSPDVFVGRHGYPKVNTGPMATTEEEAAVRLQSPSKWFGMPYESVIELQTFLVRSKVKKSIHSRDRFTQDNQLLALAKRPTDVELDFRKKPSFNMKLDRISNPVVVTADLDELRIAENVKVARPVDKVVNDELKAAQGAAKMFDKGIDPYKIMTILSSGSLGMDEDRKMVPTRWSITATDDMLFREMVPAIKDSKSINKFEVYESEYLYNKFIVVLMPGNWEFENFESWAPNSSWAQSMKEFTVIPEYEPFEGRSDYADSQAGGYYATRFSVAEALHRRRRQARALVFREVSEGYVFPVGVWQVRENVRNALMKEPVKFDTLDATLSHVKPRLRVPFDEYRSRSVLLRQKRLSEFLSDTRVM